MTADDDELEDDDLDLFCHLDVAPGRELATPNPLAWRSLQRAGAVALMPPPARGRRWTVRALVAPEDLGL